MLCADGRADAVGGNHHVGLDFAAIGEARHCGSTDRIGADAMRAEMERRIARGAAQQVVQVGAVRRHIGRAIFFARHCLERLAKPQPALIVGNRRDAQRLKRIAHQLVFEPERAQDLDAVGPDLKPSADLFKLGDTLIERDLEAALPQRYRRGQTADAGADDCNAKGAMGLGHWNGPVLGKAARRRASAAAMNATPPTF